MNYPRLFWLQYFDDDGEPLDPEDRTYSEDYRVAKLERKLREATGNR